MNFHWKKFRSLTNLKSRLGLQFKVFQIIIFFLNNIIFLKFGGRLLLEMRHNSSRYYEFFSWLFWLKDWLFVLHGFTHIDDRGIDLQNA